MILCFQQTKYHFFCKAVWQQPSKFFAFLISFDLVIVQIISSRNHSKCLNAKNVSWTSVAKSNGYYKVLYPSKHLTLVPSFLKHCSLAVLPPVHRFISYSVSGCFQVSFFSAAPGLFHRIPLSPLSTLNLMNQSFPNQTGNPGLFLGSRFINTTGC